MNTQCNKEQISFQAQNRQKVVADFNGGSISSDAGCLVLRELETKFKIINQLSTCFIDHRNPKYCEHSLKELLARPCCIKGKI
jgi:Transposase DDE domain group 1